MPFSFICTIIRLILMCHNCVKMLRTLLATKATSSAGYLMGMALLAEKLLAVSATPFP
jgi:hypothetical protein